LCCISSLGKWPTAIATLQHTQKTGTEQPFHCVLESLALSSGHTRQIPFALLHVPKDTSIMSTTVSANSIKAQMPHPILTHMFKNHTQKQVKAVIHELTANLMAIPCPWENNKGHLCLLQDQAIYLSCNGEVFIFPAIKPPPYLVIPNGATTTECKELCINNVTGQRAWASYKLVLSITRDQLVASIDDI
jgi:hypothetical protein